MFRLLACVWVAALSLSLITNPADARPPRSLIVIDAESGRVLLDEAPDRLIHPASLTKMMTLYLLFDALRSGRLKMTSRIPFSRKASRQPPSKLGVRKGRSISVKTAIYALAVKSANDVAVAVAERLGGTEKKFAKRMNAKAQALGMARTNFKNASGLHHKDQVTTARDLSRLARGIFYKHKRYYKYFKVKSFRYNRRTYRTHNHFIRAYRGADGIKTGYIKASGFNLAGAAVRGPKGKARRLIAVVIGGKSAASRDINMKSLMDTGFANARHLGKPRYAGIAPVAIDWRNGLPAKVRRRPGTKPAATPRRRNTRAIASNRRVGPTQYSVQVGAVRSQTAALKLAKRRLSELGPAAVGGRAVSVKLARRGGGALHRARIAGLPASIAQNACVILKRAGHGCLVVASANG